MEPLPNTAAAISKDHGHVEAAHKHLQEIDKRIHDLTQSREVLHQSIRELKESDTATISDVLKKIQTKHTIPEGVISPGDIQKFLEDALHGVHAEIERLHEGRETLQALSSLGETSELVQNIADHAEPATKYAMARVSKGWSRDTLNSLRTEGDRFIKERIDGYIAALSSQEEWNSSSEQIELVKKKLNEIQKLSFLETSTFADIQSRIFDLRNLFVEALLQLDPRDFEHLPSVPEPSTPLQNDLLHVAFSNISKMLSLSCSSGDNRQDLIDLFTNEGDLRAALEIAKEFKDNPFIHSQALCKIVYQMVKRGDYDGALVVVNEISNKNFPIVREALALIGSKFAIDGKFEKAYGVACQISFPKALEVIDTMASEMAKTGTLEEALEAAHKWANSDFGNVSMALSDGIRAEFATKKAKMGNIREALDDLLKISSDYFKQQLISNIAQEMAKRGDIKGALELAESLPEEDILFKEYKKKALLVIAQEMANRGDKDGAFEVTQGRFDEDNLRAK